MALYADVLGPAWLALPPAVRRIHDVGRARGVFDVERGPGLLTRAVAWLFRLPPAGRQVPVELDVTADHGLQRWTRSFGGAPLVSVQRRDGAVLLERLGPVECELATSGEGGTLHMRSTRVGFWLGPLRIAVPRVVRPQIVARVDGDGAAAQVHVEIRMAGLLLMRYVGRAEPV